ncbi:putative non-heme bromoperoxidase BpoC [subsurface metagenome]
MKEYLSVPLVLSMVMSLMLGTFTQNVSSSQQTLEKGATRGVAVGDIEVAYQIFGEGDPLLLIMGYSGTMDLWAPEVLKELASKYQVIIFDNRGMGKTTASDKEFTIELFADDTRGLLDALGIERAHVLGWSLGTYIAQELALRYPGRVEKLILYAGDCGGKEAIYPGPEIMDALGDTSASSRERGERLLATLFPEKWLKEHPDPRTYFPRVTETSSSENIKRQYQSWQKWKGSYSRLASITQPTLLITGAEDVNTPWQNSLMLIDLIPGAWLVQLEAGGHGVMYQYPKKFGRIVLTFLAS